MLDRTRLIKRAAQSSINLVTSLESLERLGISLLLQDRLQPLLLHHFLSPFFTFPIHRSISTPNSEPYSLLSCGVFGVLIFTLSFTIPHFCNYHSVLSHSIDPFTAHLEHYHGGEQIERQNVPIQGEVSGTNEGAFQRGWDIQLSKRPFRQASDDRNPSSDPAAPKNWHCDCSQMADSSRDKQLLPGYLWTSNYSPPP